MKSRIQDVFKKAQKPKPTKAVGRHTDETRKFIDRLKDSKR